MALEQKRAFSAVRDERGTVLVELAASLPVFAALLIGVVELGLFAWRNIAFDAAIEGGVLYTSGYVAQYGWSGGTTSPPRQSSATAIGNVIKSSASVGGTINVTSVTCQYGCPRDTSSGTNQIDRSGNCVDSNSQPLAPGYSCSGGENPGQYVQISANLTGYASVFSFLYPIQRTVMVRIQ